MFILKQRQHRLVREVVNMSRSDAHASNSLNFHEFRETPIGSADDGSFAGSVGHSMPKTRSALEVVLETQAFVPQALATGLFQTMTGRVCRQLITENNQHPQYAGVAQIIRHALREQEARLSPDHTIICPTDRVLTLVANGHNQQSSMWFCRLFNNQTAIVCSGKATKLFLNGDFNSLNKRNNQVVINRDQVVQVIVTSNSRQLLFQGDIPQCTVTEGESTVVCRFSHPIDTSSALSVTMNFPKSHTMITTNTAEPVNVAHANPPDAEPPSVDDPSSACALRR